MISGRVGLGNRSLSGYQSILLAANGQVADSLKKLSSGMRINDASDDAAALAEVATLDLHRKVFDRGLKNIADGMSVNNVVGNSFKEMKNIIIRLKELAQQGSNGTYTEQQRSSLQSETNALQSEYNRIIQSTRFNGDQLLTGDTTSLKYQLGFGDSGSISLQIGKSQISDAFGYYSAGETIRVNVAEDGTQANGETLSPAQISGDGSSVTFVSEATNLISGVSGTQVYLRNNDTGEVTLASSSASGVMSNGTQSMALISLEGTRISFVSDATNLITGVSGTQVYSKNMLTGEISLVSSSSAGVIGNGTSSGGHYSADNKFLSFISNSTNLQGGVSGVQVYLKNLETGETSVISTSANGTVSNGAALESAFVSGNGRFVSFKADANNLISGVSGSQIYRKDVLTGEIKLISASASGVMGNGNSFAAHISADGQLATFQSNSSNLIAGVTGTQIYQKNLSTDEIRLVSATSIGTAGNANSTWARMNNDGRYVAFRSLSSNLVEGASGIQIYRKDMQTGEVSLVSRSTDGVLGDLSADIPGRPSITDDGMLVSFTSSGSNLVSGDSNGFFDVFVRDMSKAGIQELAGVVVSDQGSARLTLENLEKYFNEINLADASVGASTSRLVHGQSHLSSMSTNFATASSKIRDVDVAEETTKLLSAQMLQKYNISIMAQANQNSDVVLSLLN